MDACSICGHSAQSCGHTDADRAYNAALEARVRPVQTIVITAREAQRLWTVYSVMELEQNRCKSVIAWAAGVGGWELTNVGGTGDDFDCYRLVPRAEFKEPTWTDSTRESTPSRWLRAYRHAVEPHTGQPYWDPHLKDPTRILADDVGDQWRHAPNGCHHGQRVKCKGRDLVMQGPPIHFVVNKEQVGK